MTDNHTPPLSPAPANPAPAFSEIGERLTAQSGIVSLMDDLGRAKRVTVDKDNTTIVDGAGSQKAIEGRIKQLRAQIDETTSDYDREKLQERLAKLAGGVAVIRVGGATEVEVKERKDRVDDAMHATRAAVADGDVPQRRESVDVAIAADIGEPDALAVVEDDRGLVLGGVVLRVNEVCEVIAHQARNRRLVQCRHAVPQSHARSRTSCAASPRNPATIYSLCPASGAPKRAAIASRAAAFGMVIGYHNRRPREDAGTATWFDSVTSLATWADDLVVATPGGAATRHIVNAEVLAMARELGMNVSRTVDALLAEEVKRQYWARWNEQNSAAIDQYNERIERDRSERRGAREYQSHGRGQPVNRTAERSPIT